MLLKEALDKFEELRNADAEEEAKANRKFANADDEVSLHDGSKVKVSEIIERLNKCNEEEAEKEEEKANEEAEEEDKETPPPAKEEEEEKANEEPAEEEKENKCNEDEEEEKEEEKENKKKNSTELRNAFLNSGLSQKIEDDENYKRGKELVDGFEKAKQMGI